jgi:phage-related protein
MVRWTRVPGEKPLFWVGSSKDDLLEFPEPVQDEIGIALSVHSLVKSIQRRSRGKE